MLLRRTTVECTPNSLLEAVRHYSDLDRCERKMALMKWPDGKPVCPKCGCGDIGRIEKRRMYQCRSNECRKQFSVKVGTIFEESKIGLDKWFVAVWCIANCKNGISSHELARALSVTQKTAWFMLHRIREAMDTGSFHKLDGVVEVDETFVGGKAKNMHTHKREAVIDGRGPVNKTAVQGLLERGGEVRVFVQTKTDADTLQRTVQRNVERTASVFTDAATAYSGLGRSYLHQTIDHVREYVRGNVHTNGIENFWSLLKRAIKGTYVHVAPFHLQRYAVEQASRFNSRKINDGNRFELVLSGVVGKRLTYRRLCAIGDAGFMGIE